MNVELTHLRYFHAVAATLSFVRGAERCHVTPPAISKAIRKLEDDLGVALFHRTTRRVALTEAGEILVRHAERMLGVAGELEEELSASRGQLRGDLRIGANELFTTLALPRALSRLVGVHPDVVPRTFVMRPEDSERAVLEGALDVGFCAGGVTTGHVSSVQLVSTPASLVCGPQHPLAGSAIATPSDVARYPFVVMSFFGREWMPALDNFPEDLYPRRVGATCESLAMAIQMVLDGAYLGFFPNVAIRCQLNHGELVALTGLQLPSWELRAILRREGRPKRAVEALLDLMNEALIHSMAVDCAV